MISTVFGLLALGIPPLVLAWVLLRRNLAVFFLFLALLVAGMGYLVATGAVRDVGEAVRVLFGHRLGGERAPVING